MKTTRYSGPPGYDKAERAEYMTIRVTYPDAYVVPGLGYCGPGWVECAAAMKTLDEKHAQRRCAS